MPFRVPQLAFGAEQRVRCIAAAVDGTGVEHLGQVAVDHCSRARGDLRLPRHHLLELVVRVHLCQLLTNQGVIAALRLLGELGESAEMTPTDGSPDDGARRREELDRRSVESAATRTTCCSTRRTSRGL